MKVAYIISNLEYAIAFEWIAKEIGDTEIELSFIFLNPQLPQLASIVQSHGAKIHFVHYNGKISIPIAILSVWKILKQINPDIIHCHMLDASVVGLLSGKMAGVKKRIYTRHHSSFHHVYFPKAVWIDKVCNFLSTNIVAISRTVEEILLKEDVDKNKIKLIYHGFELDIFQNINHNQIRVLNEKYNSHHKYPVIGVISRWTEWKGIQFIIPAFKKLLQEYPDAKLLLFNAKGDYVFTINSLLSQLPSNSFMTIEFESDIKTLYHVFDIFIHTPIDSHSEAFGQTYVESLASGIPSVFSLSGIANEFIVNRQNALVVPYQNSDAIFNAITELLDNKKLSHEIVENGKKDVVKLFQLKEMINKLKDLYYE